MAITNILVTKKENISPARIEHHPLYQYDKYEIVPRNGGNQCAVIMYDILPGKSSYPFHYHSSSEEVFFIISGQGTLETVDGVVPVSTGTIIVCPVGESGAHKLTNISSCEPLSYIDIDTVPKTDMATYPHTGKIAIFTTDGFAKLYWQNSNVPYYDGE